MISLLLLKNIETLPKCFEILPKISTNPSFLGETLHTQLLHHCHALVVRLWTILLLSVKELILDFCERNNSVGMVQSFPLTNKAGKHTLMLTPFPPFLKQLCFTWCRL